MKFGICEQSYTVSKHLTRPTLMDMLKAYVIFFFDNFFSKSPEILFLTH